MSRSAPVRSETAALVREDLNLSLVNAGEDTEKSIAQLRGRAAEDDPNTAWGAFLFMSTLPDWISRVRDVAAASLYADGTTTREMEAHLEAIGVEVSHQTIYRQVLRGMELAGVDPETMREEPKS